MAENVEKLEFLFSIHKDEEKFDYSTLELKTEPNIISFRVKHKYREDEKTFERYWPQVDIKILEGLDLLNTISKIYIEITKQEKTKEINYISWILTGLWLVLYENSKKSIGAQDIYFMKNNEGLIKIGKSNDIEYRKGTLENYYGELIVLKTLSGQGEIENKLHRKFKKLKYKNYPSSFDGYTEWFRPESELLDFIEKITEDNINELC